MRMLTSVMLAHFLIGLGFTFAAEVFARNKKKHRRVFHFGGDGPFSWGPRNRWVLWFLLAYAFEAITSFAMGPSLYNELALSLIEALALTVGAFTVDRTSMLFSEEQESTSTKESRQEKVRREFEETIHGN